MYAKITNTTAVLNAFILRLLGEKAADCNSMRSSNDGTAIPYAQHRHSEACYPLSRLSGTTPAPRAICFDKSTLAASIAHSAPPTYKDTIKSNIKRALCQEDAGTASLTGAAFPSSLLQIGGSRALIGSGTIIGLTRMLYRITKDRHADVPSESVYSVSSPISVKCISPTPQAAVSLTETLILPSSIHYTDLHAQAVVPPTGTTPLFYPPPPPESEPYNTGQTQ
ncbi:hypothetical protein CC77DRAFT_288032 [Alternaria alternata]|uniref:Uncharacterized protein n=2 Tax=Alternaria alternata complex TaxID=187734 RepID=A0A177DDV7_ALTAL|nr:hypothetical protein CC77DRAFT_288032 [Alternaria alternata]OAG17352.1 hypothetical protein CC77DRAFT_288032 [Alternaria alternata]RYN50539.1 hypothetical protein AA0118_g10934 [Alternaria tenuissima]RYN95448.1 hypothetical protein AA0119_g8708 [Alternaria tenuissima]RYO10915.1 hypothetical protein AA0121_g10340 [Alternaria tenuissima]